MRRFHPSNQALPKLWLLSDARNDATFLRSMRVLPQGSGIVWRHYHLSDRDREVAFKAIARLARSRGLCVIWAGTSRDAARMGADGHYGAFASGGRSRARIWLATAHDMRELGRANGRGADLVLLSPAYPTRTHPGGKTLGPVRFALLARLSDHPVIALGGMTQRRARALSHSAYGWAAIDGLSGHPGL